MNRKSSYAPALSSFGRSVCPVLDAQTQLPHKELKNTARYFRIQLPFCKARLILDFSECTMVYVSEALISKLPDVKLCDVNYLFNIYDGDSVPI